MLLFPILFITLFDKCILVRADAYLSPGLSGKNLISDNISIEAARISKNKKKYEIINSNLPIDLNKKIIIEKIEKLIR